jgi:hypothetical protein
LTSHITAILVITSSWRGSGTVCLNLDSSTQRRYRSCRLISTITSKVCTDAAPVLLPSH